MISTIKRHLARRPFLFAVVLALLVVPSLTTLAFFSATATGTGTISNIQVGSAPTSTVAITTDSLGYSNGVDLVPGSSFTVRAYGQCLTQCPTTVSTLTLQSWTSAAPGCTQSAFPSQFPVGQVVLAVDPSRQSVGNGSPQYVGDVTIAMANLAVSQNACAGSSISFLLSVG